MNPVCIISLFLIGLDLNRGLRDENGEMYDIVAGTFLVVGLGEEDLASLSPELIQKYTEQFKTPERFMQINGNIVVLPVPAEKERISITKFSIIPDTSLPYSGQGGGSARALADALADPAVS